MKNNELFYTSVSTDKTGKICFSGYKNTERIYKKFDYFPYLFELTDDPSSTIFTELNFSRPIKKTKFETIKSFREYVSMQRNCANPFPIFGTTDIVTQVITDIFPKELKVDSSLIDIGILDLEVDSSNGFPFPKESKEKILSITHYSSKRNTYFVWGLKPYDVSMAYNSELRIEYKQFSTERELLEDYIVWWSMKGYENCPDIISGWYVENFDIPYLLNRIQNLFSEKIRNKFSPFENVYEKFNLGNANEPSGIFCIVGVEQLDYLDLFKKFGKNTYGNQENYKLNTIAEIVLKDSKIEYDEEYENLSKLYELNPQKFIDYNIKDVELVKRMEDEIGMIGFATALAYTCGVNYKLTLSTIQIWDTLIYRYLLRKNIVPEIKLTIPPKETKYTGAFVKEPIIGLKKWIVSFDINSMYPNIIIEKNMSPETLISGGYRSKTFSTPEELINSIDNPDWNLGISENDFTVAANGVCFGKNRLGIIPEIISNLYKERVLIKNEMIQLKKLKETNHSIKYSSKIATLENRQIGIKILLNSVYGAMGNRFFRYYEREIAEAVTTTGQMVILSLEKL